MMCAKYLSRRNKTFIDLVLEILWMRNISRAHLANEIGVNESVVNRWIAGAMQPRDRNLIEVKRIHRKSYLNLLVDLRSVYCGMDDKNQQETSKGG